MSDIQQLLHNAAHICQQRGARFTPIRRRVLELLLEHGRGASAYDLLDGLKSTDASAKPPTVYRALDFLLEQHFIHRVESQNAFVACNDFSDSHPLQLLICDGCNEIQELHAAPVQQAMLEQGRLNDFQIVSQTIEAHGLCHRCRQD